MKKFYTVFFDEIPFTNSPSLKNVLFVSLDKNSWLEIKDKKELTINDYDDVVDIFTPKKVKNGYTSFINIASRWLNLLAYQSNKDFKSMIKTIQ
tara:strand:+ start:111 stop:392 length:282 start_codon:yes stop_codon:yes gene_type:complete